MAEDLGNLAVRVGMDSSGFNDGIAQINRSLRVANSGFRTNTAAIGGNGTALDRLRLKHTSLTTSMGLQQQKVSALEAAYNRSVTATGADSRATQNLEVRLNQARASLSNMGNQLGTVDRQIATQSSSWTRLGTTLNNAGERMKKVGTTLKNVGSKLSMSITAPLVATGVAAAKLGIDFETSMAKVSTIADNTDVPIAVLRKAILKLSNDTGIASTEIANNVYDAISAGQSTGDAVKFVTNSTKLAKAGFAEAGQSLDLLTTIMNSYGLESKEVNKVSDILVQTQNKGKLTVAELSTSMGKIIPTANSLGVNLEQVATGYAIMTSKGIKAAETTTYMNSMFNEMGKSGTAASKVIEKASGKSFPELIKSGKSVGDILSIMNEYAKKNNKSLTDMFGSAEAGKAALILSGDQGKDFNKMLESMGKSAGATDEAFAKVSNTTGERLTKSLNSLKNAGIQLGDSLSPIIEKIASGVKSLTDKFKALTPTQKENIVKYGLMIAAIGPVVSIVGTLVTIGGALVTGLGAISTAMGVASVATAGVGTAAAGAAGAAGVGGLGVALGGAVIAAAPFLLLGAGVVGAGLLIKKAMDKDAVPSVDLFADKVTTTATSVKGDYASMSAGVETNTIKISASTKKAVGAYIKMDDDATKAISDLYVNSTTITDKIATSLETKYNDMNTKIQGGIEKHYTNQLATMQTFFTGSSALTTKEETQILVNMEASNATKKGLEDSYNNQILAIIKKAKDKHRALTLEEQQSINEIQNTMKINAVKSLSDGEIESKVILERLKGYTTRITAEQASAEIKNANKARDGSVKAAKEKYNKTVAETIKMRDETHTITEDQAKKLIASAKLQKKDTIKQAEEMRSGVVKKITSMNTDVEESVNTSTGEILDGWGKLAQWWDRWEPARKKFFSQIFSSEQTTTPSYSIRNRAIGDKDFQGGLTTLHEKGYEVYDLPQATRIYNHDASEDLVLKTAKEVAKGVLANSNSQNGLNLNIENFVNNKTQDMENLATELAFYMKQKSLGGSR